MSQTVLNRSAADSNINQAQVKSFFFARESTFTDYFVRAPLESLVFIISLPYNINLGLSLSFP